ncbi:hypothetical protein IMCC3317_26050 [Kordia antarctica]|uniref:Uncharacterized protein n=1 Tax=Kordia antarctica TaxID=1218801 RepID=A0A7L4ZL82_9FLAO|nr:hypothetical protein [Kordia antarctica]QHI37227.1 hypothetical protein IMCC3317_26050 [Kordia antarctica]
MNQLDQHNAILSLEQALVPTAGLVDSRTEADNLRLLVDFSSLFNFYDQTNKINGSWSPFLLKDPVFLIASIAKTAFQKIYSLFINTCSQLGNAVTNELHIDYITNGFNQLFDQIIYVFKNIERWTHYTQESSLEYNLKTYIVNNVTNTYGLILWSLLDLREQLFTYGNSPNITFDIPGIQKVNRLAFTKYDKKIWKNNKGELPYWTVLGLPTSPCFDDQNDVDDEQQCFYIEKLTQKQLFTALYNTGKKVFAFYSNCISSAETELKTVQTVPGHFPDTILLRTFTSLLKIYQGQLNSLSEKHLKFYYDDILKQAPKSVSPDTVFAASNLAKKTANFQLLKNTVFTAGLDAEKQAILFETTKNVWLNPAKIANTYTLFQQNVHTYHSELYLQKLPPVNVIAKDEAGAIKTWKTFGSQPDSTIKPNKMAIAFGSPLLYLTEAASRVITFNFTLTSSTFTEIIKQGTSFYLSTEKAWFEIPASQVVRNFTTPDYKLPLTIDRTLTMTITLQPTDPVIAAFTKNPDGYTSDWPLFKMQFSEFENLANPPKIKTLTIDVSVNGLQNFALYTDLGMLNAKKPFQPLGPTPAVNQNFMVGSAEIFSKPTNSFTLTIDWNAFPAKFDFAVYYTEYNNYLNNIYSKEPKDVAAAKKIIQEIISSEEVLFQNILSSQTTLFKSLIGTKQAAAKKLIDKGNSNLTNLIQTQNKTLQKLVDPKNATIKDVITQHSILLSNIVSEETALLKAIDTDGIIDAQKTIETEGTVFSEISTTENTVIQKLINAESTILETPLPKKKSSFKNIFGSLGNIFHRQDNTKMLLEDPTLTEDTTPFQFSNTSFMVNFEWLQNGLWQYFNMYQSEVIISSASNLNLFFPLETTNTVIPNTRTFTFAGLEMNPSEIDPTLQKTPLLLSEKSTTGFIKMQLVTPDDGFGLDLYPKVIGAIALYNGRLIANKSSDPLINPPSLPFAPTISLFSGNYTASASYDFSTNEAIYPLECFYNTPFQNYKVYDTTNTKEKITTKYTTLGNSPERDETGTIIPLTALPLVPEFSSRGQLFLELEDVIAPANVSFYFELARTYTEKAVTTEKVTYSYLSKDGWKTITSVVDGTNNFTCSGIITLYIPADITTEHETIAGTNFWIAIGTTDNPANFPQTSFLKTNGITLQRIVASNDFSTVTPQIKANVITTPQTAIPEISATIQPFASFGGKAAETNPQMNSRVSTRLKTKDRLLTSEDYFNVIRLQFLEVYYSKSIYNKKTKKVTTYVLKRVSDVTDTNAFVPLLSECNELEIQNYIKERVSPFTTVSVENFELNYVKITATIIINTGEDVTTVSKEINNDINVYMSPWITSAQSQITIDTGLNTAQLASFITSYDSIIEVKSISLQIGTKDFTTGEITFTTSTQELKQTDGIILVPSLNNITANSLITYQL